MSQARAKIIEVLDRWAAGEMTASEVWDWSLSVHGTDEFVLDDTDAEGESLAEQILAHLDLIDTNFVLPEDIPHMKTLLAAGPEEARDALESWIDYTESIDYDDRIERYRDQPPYDRAFALLGDDIPVD